MRWPVQWVCEIEVVPGWQDVRVELGKISDVADLSYVQAVAWRVPRTAAPAEFCLDDVVLVDDTRYLVGQEAQAGRDARVQPRRAGLRRCCGPA